MNTDIFKQKEVRRMVGFASFAVLMLGIFLVFASLNSIKEWRTVDTASNVMSVNGQGESYALPDVASFTFSVSADAKQVADAQNSVTSKMNSILADLKGMGVEDKDVKTVDYSINPKYVYPTATICTTAGCPPTTPQADGYTVIHSVAVKIHKTDDAGKALAVVGAKGATNVSGISFTTDDPDQGMNEARAKAIDNARAKAEEIADHLGVHVVRVVSYSDTQSPYPVYDYAGSGVMKASAVAVAPSLPVGQNRVTSNVTVTYEIR